MCETTDVRDEERFPHSPDVLERDSADGEFSAGWGLHHQSSEDYIIDCHTHMSATDADAVQKAVNTHFQRGGAHRLGRQVALDGSAENIEAFTSVSEADSRFMWMLRMDHEKPDLDLLKTASGKCGFVGLKILNIRLIKEAASPGVWCTKQWDDIFEFCGKIAKPVLWHVTQRKTAAPYMGGGKNSYWKELPSQHPYGNESLIDVLIDRLTTHTQTNFIGAHHLHMGPGRVGDLLDKHDNLNVDYSCGNIVRAGDIMYDDDRDIWRDYTIHHADRLLFGTDCILGGTAEPWYLWETLMAHIRFLHQLHLPADVLNKVAHGNFEKLAHLPEHKLNPGLWAAVKP